MKVKNDKTSYRLTTSKGVSHAKVTKEITNRKKTLRGLTGLSVLTGSYTIRRLRPRKIQSDVSSRNHKNSTIKNTTTIKHKRKDGMSLLTARIKKSIFKPRHTLVSHGRVYNVCKTCPSYHRKRLRLLKT